MALTRSTETMAGEFTLAWARGRDGSGAQGGGLTVEETAQEIHVQNAPGLRAGPEGGKMMWWVCLL